MTTSDDPPVPAPAGREGWKQSIDGEIEQLGWSSSTRIDQPDDDVTIYIIDVLPSEDMVFTPEGPATFSLSVFLDGMGTLSVDGASPFTITPGSAVLFACNHVTRGENHISAGKRLHVVDIRFEARLLEKLGGVSLARLGGALMTEHSLPEQDVFLIGFKAPAELLGVAAAFGNCQIKDPLPRRLHLYSKAIEALSIGLDSLSKHADAGGPRPLSPDELQKLDAAVDIIGSDYSADWTIAKLARRVGLNERRLKEGFRLAIGQSVHSYLRTVRLDAAALLLSNGASVTEAAHAVGFENLSHFSKIFREHKGMLPSRYE